MEKVVKLIVHLEKQRILGSEYRVSYIGCWGQKYNPLSFILIRLFLLSKSQIINIMYALKVDIQNKRRINTLETLDISC
jgi:hypothetical protein